MNQTKRPYRQTFESRNNNNSGKYNQIIIYSDKNDSDIRQGNQYDNI